jgi:hypothetical protein
MFGFSVRERRRTTKCSRAGPKATGNYEGGNRRRLPRLVGLRLRHANVIMFRCDCDVLLFCLGVDVRLIFFVRVLLPV